MYFADARTGWVVGNDGTILATHDGGASWVAQESGSKTYLGRVHFVDARSGWVLEHEGILVTRDGGAKWEAQQSGTKETLWSIYFANARTGWAVGEKGTILTTRDGGTNWKAEPSGTREDLIDVRFADANTGWAVGKNGTLLHAGPAAYAPWVDARTVRVEAPAGGLTGKLDVSFAVHADDPAAIKSISLWGRAGRAEWTRLGAPEKVDDVSGRWHVVWRPEEINIHPGDRVAYQARLDDGGPPLPPFELGPPIPYLCRHPRVRRAWTERYRQGKAGLGDLGKPARESFVTEPEVLDAWVETRIRRVIAALDSLELFKQRRIYVAVPARVDDREAGLMLERPSAETLKEYFTPQRAVVAIVGAGGGGKSTLACALARWAVADDPKERLAKHRMLPVFIVEDTTDLVKSVTRNLRRMLGDEELPEDLVRGLLAKQRILVVVDALSERDPASQQHVEQIFAENVPLNAIVITSRTEPLLGAVTRTALYLQRLDAARVVPFIIGYVDRLEHAEGLKDGRAQLRLGERILALAEAGGRRTPVTPLLVRLLVESAVAQAVEGKSFEDMPDAVPEVFVDYLRRLNSGGAQASSAVRDDVFIQAAQIVAGVSLGPNLVPQDFSLQQAMDALSKGAPGEQTQALMNRLVATGLIERRTPGGIPMLRFGLDPAAEYLAAIRTVFELKTAGQAGWQKYLAELARRKGYPTEFDGYLTALGTCYRAYRHDFKLPDIHFSWETEDSPTKPMPIRRARRS